MLKHSQHLFLTLILALLCTLTYGQSTPKIAPFGKLKHTRTLVHNQTPEADLFLADDIRVDEAGNFYMAAAKFTHPCWFFSTEHGKVELDTIERWGNNGHDSRFLYVRYPDKLYYKPFYYGAKVYGPFEGRIHALAFSNRYDDQVGFMIMRNDSIFHYINDSLVDRLQRLEALTPNGRYRQWFQNNPAGDFAYFVRRGDTDYLYRDHQLLDSAYQIDDLRMYEDGTCTWFSLANPKDRTGTYQNDRGITMEIPAAHRGWKCLKDTAYSLQACNSMIMGTQDIEVADLDGGFSHYEKSVVIAEQSDYPPNGKHYIAQCPLQDSLGMTRYYAFVDGQKKEPLFHNLTQPAIDEKGNFSYWGNEIEGVSRVTNGKVYTDPEWEKPSERAEFTPIYISPDGTVRWKYLHLPGHFDMEKYKRVAPDTFQLLRNGSLIKQVISEDSRSMVIRSDNYNFGRSPDLPWAKRAIEVRMHKETYILQAGKLSGPYPTPGFLNEPFFESLPKAEQKVYRKMKYKQHHIASFPILEYDGLTDGSYYLVQEQGDRILVIFNNRQLTLPKSKGAFIPNTCRFQEGNLSFLVRKGKSIYRYVCEGS